MNLFLLGTFSWAQSSSVLLGVGQRKASAAWGETSVVLGPSLPPTLFLASGKQPLPPRQQGQCRDGHLLSHLQGDDDEDGSPVHSSHAAAVAHEVVEDGGELGAHLPGRGERTLSRELGAALWAGLCPQRLCRASRGALGGATVGAPGRGRVVTWPCSDGDSPSWGEETLQGLWGL